MSACVLYINNLRDVVSDKVSGKLTLAIVLDKYQIVGYFALLLLAMLCYVCHLLAFAQGAWVLILAMPLLIQHIYAVHKHRTNPARLGKELGVIVSILVLMNGLIIISP